MKTIILHPTETCQWHALINEAQASAQIVLNESTESYLVFTLMRYSQVPKMMESVIALDFLHTMQRPGSLQIEGLREVGDKSLLFCGLFPGIAAKRRVNLTYFSEMGQAAYLTVSELKSSSESLLFIELSENFLALQQVLRAIRNDESLQQPGLLAANKETIQFQ